MADKKKQLAVKPSTQITQAKKARFIDFYRETNGHISNSARAIGIERKTYYNWLDSDPEFARAIMEAEAELNDEIRDVLVSKAGDGDMTAVIFYLKSRHPDFKQQSQQINISGEKVIAILGGASHALPEDNSNQQDTTAKEEN